ncbi:MAG: hypothetical protein ACTS5Y_08715, partial [Pollutimonas bauzanensis]
FALASPPEWLSQTLDRLARVSARMPLWLGRGNRDFLMGEALARRVGARLLPDTVCLATDSGPVLLSHGDEYCVADAGYQRMRRIVRNPAVQKAYLGGAAQPHRALPTGPENAAWPPTAKSRRASWTSTRAPSNRHSWIAVSRHWCMAIRIGRRSTG